MQTNEDYIKLQMRSLLSNPKHNKQLKKNLKKVGLYNARLGFGAYKYFIDAELNRKRSKSINSRYYPSFTSNQRKNMTPLPKITSKNPKQPSGVLDSDFFSRGKISVSCVVLYKLLSKVNIIPGIEDYPKDKIASKTQKSEIKSEFCGFYFYFFLSIARNTGGVLQDGAIHLPPDIDKQVSSLYLEINRLTSTGKKTKVSLKDTRFFNFLELKPWIGSIAESLNRFYTKKYTVLGERNFTSFIANYLLTSNLTNMQKLCFDMYDRRNNSYINSSDLFMFFESPVFPLIKSDLFVMINYLSNYKYSIDNSLIKRRPSLYFQELTEKENRKINFKTFMKLRFDQKFPDMLLVLVHALFGDAVVNYFCSYYKIHKYRVSLEPEIALSRPINYCKHFYQITCDHYKTLKPELMNYKPVNKNFNMDLLKGIAVGYLIICESEALCESRILGVTQNSISKRSEFFLGKKCPELMKRVFYKLMNPYFGQITLNDFIEYMEGYFNVINI